VSSCEGKMVSLALYRSLMNGAPGARFPCPVPISVRFYVGNNFSGRLPME
jgi:hypothetical protein